MKRIQIFSVLFLTIFVFSCRNEDIIKPMNSPSTPVPNPWPETPADPPGIPPSTPTTGGTGSASGGSGTSGGGGNNSPFAGVGQIYSGYVAGKHYATTIDPNSPPPAQYINGRYYGSLQDFRNNDGEFSDFVNGFNIDEIVFFTTFWYLIPQANANKRAAEAGADWYFYDGNIDFFNANAFKHMIWSGYNTLSFGITFAITIAKNHESNNFVSLPTQMDMFNNYVGIDFGTSSQSQTEIIDKALNAVTTGQGRILIGGNLIPTDGTGRKR